MAEQTPEQAAADAAVADIFRRIEEREAEAEALVSEAVTNGKDFTDCSAEDVSLWSCRLLSDRPDKFSEDWHELWDATWRHAFQRTAAYERICEPTCWPYGLLPPLRTNWLGLHGMSYPMHDLENLAERLNMELVRIDKACFKPESQCRDWEIPHVLSRGYEWFEHFTGKLRPDDSAHPERDRLMMLITRVRQEIAAAEAVDDEVPVIPDPALGVKEKIPGVQIDADKKRVRRGDSEATLKGAQWHLFHAVYRALPGGATRESRENGYEWDLDLASMRKVKDRLNDVLAGLNLCISKEWALVDTLPSIVPPRPAKTVRTVP